MTDRLEPVPSHILSAFTDKGIREEDIILAASSDLDLDGNYRETWLAVTHDSIAVLMGYYEESAESGGHAHIRAATGDEIDNVSLADKRNGVHNADYGRGAANGRHGKNGKDQHGFWIADSYKEYPVSKVIKLSAENLVSTGMLTASMDSDTVICCFSNTHLRKFGMLAKLFNKVKEGKELTDEDFRDELARERCPKCGKYYPDAGRKVCPSCLNKRALFVKVLSFAPPYKKKIALIFFFMLMGAVFDIIHPYLGNRVFFDYVLMPGGRYYGKVLEIILVIMFLRLSAIALGVMQGRVNAKVANEMVFDIKSRIFTAMQRLSLRFYNNKQTGSLMNRVNNDAAQLQNFFLDGLPYFLLNLIKIISICVILFSINWKLAFVVLLPTPLIIFFVKKMFPKLFMLFSRRFRRGSEMNSIINDSLTGARVVKAFGKESEEITRFKNINMDYYKVNVDINYLVSTMFPSLRFIIGAGGIIIWAAGSWEVVNGNITFGTMMTFVGYLGMIYGPLEFMTQIVNWWSNCMNSAQRIFEVLEAVPDVVEAPEPVKMPGIDGSIELRNVTFSYEPNKPVLHEINLEIKAGEMIGLVGHSGAGKSTLTNIITRLYDVNEGEILIDGVNIKDIAFSDLRPEIGMVLQDTYLFRGTVAENIAYARPDASEEEIIKAAKAANAHDFIVSMPDGYDTVLGRQKSNLSGGERQRVSIARALLHDPKILILDEATASVDTETERLIQEALERLIRGRTTIAIAHRLSTLRNADRLVVIEKGRIAEAGTHSELLKNEGAYFKMVQKQKEALKIKGVGE
ncbi:MAG: ABC transporter transmembrane domain-containing protein [Eubacteriales bacterium]|nr:ABC transporter transmembrane domain-containing protein [Eubacteriales bacterium]